MLQVNVARLHDDNREALSLAWIAGREGGSVVRREAAAQAALIGHLNLTHPYSIQVIGAYEAEQAGRQNVGRRAELAQRLVANKPALIIFADGVQPFPELVQAATAEGHTAVLATPASAARVIERLSHYLSKALADSTECHGVFMDVLGLGVLITGESGARQERARPRADLARPRPRRRRRGRALPRIADRRSRAAAPTLLQNLLEVRGLGLLNIRTIFGETAVRRKMKLR